MTTVCHTYLHWPPTRPAVCHTIDSFEPYALCGTRHRVIRRVPANNRSTIHYIIVYESRHSRHSLNHTTLCSNRISRACTQVFCILCMHPGSYCSLLQQHAPASVTAFYLWRRAVLWSADAMSGTCTAATARHKFAEVIFHPVCGLRGVSAI